MFEPNPLDQDHGVHPIDNGRTTVPMAGRRQLTLGGQLAVLGDMLGELHTLTLPGQSQNMSKIVGCLTKLASQILGKSSLRNQRTFADLLAKLELECQRSLPNAATFRQGADNLVALLVAAARTSTGAPVGTAQLTFSPHPGAMVAAGSFPTPHGSARGDRPDLSAT